MFELKTKLENMKSLKFFGSKVTENLKYFKLKDREDFLSNANKCYERALKYLKEDFDFDGTPFKLFSKLN